MASAAAVPLPSASGSRRPTSPPIGRGGPSPNSHRPRRADCRDRSRSRAVHALASRGGGIERWVGPQIGRNQAGEGYAIAKTVLLKRLALCGPRCRRRVGRGGRGCRRVRRAGVEELVGREELVSCKVCDVGQDLADFRGRHTVPLSETVPQALPRRGWYHAAASNVKWTSILAFGKPVGKLAENLSTLDAAAGKEHVAAPCMVRAQPIVGHGARKVRGRDDDDVFPGVGKFHLLDEG
eukprot:scaffold175444_cov50-Tisochrysis_lutea.AAC.1